MAARALILAVLGGLLLAGCSAADEPAAEAGSQAPRRPPDGRIAYLPPEGHAWPLGLVHTAGARRLVELRIGGRTPWALTWAPDAARVAYLWSRRFARFVSVLDIASGRSRTLHARPSDGDPVAGPTWFAVAWSPDGTTLALVRAGPGQPRRPGIDLVDARTGTLTARGLAPDVEYTSRLSWSADSSTVVYGTGRGRLGFVSVDTGARRRVRPPLPAADPAWSADGRLLAFETPRGIGVMRPDGGGFRLVTRRAERDRDPSWSPDSRWIAFSRQRGVCDKPDGVCRQDLHAVTAGGRALQRLRTTPRLWETGPVWAPR